MEFGLLWYDDDSGRGLEDKVERAAIRYREKFGHWPNTCYVHPQALTDRMGREPRVPLLSAKGQGTVRLLSAPNILLHHYWLGKTDPRVSLKQQPAAN
jgi:hypothetical protein